MGNASIAITFIVLGGLLGSGAVWLLYRSLLHDRSKGRPRCPKCWYDMRGSPTLVCPECGHDVKSEKRLFRTRRSRKGVMVAMALLAIAMYLLPVHRRLSHGESLSHAALPTTLLATVYGFGSAEFRTQCFERFGPEQKPAMAWAWQDSILAWQLDRVAQNDGERSIEFDRLCRLTTRSDSAAVRLALYVSEHFDAADIVSSGSLVLRNLTAAARRDSCPDLSEVFVRTYEMEGRPGTLRAAPYGLLAAARRHARSYSDPFLIRVIAAVDVAEWAKGNAGVNVELMDVLLLELANRPRIAEEVVLSRLANSRVNGENPRPWFLSMLRTIRRIRQLPEPSPIQIEALGPVRLHANEPRIVTLQVHAVETEFPNLVAQRRAYASNKRIPNATHLQLRRQDETVVPLRPLDDVVVPTHSLAGESKLEVIAPGSRRDIPLNLQDYFGDLPPGSYKLTVNHHPALAISERDDLSGLILPPAVTVDLVVE